MIWREILEGIIGRTYRIIVINDDAFRTSIPLKYVYLWKHWAFNFVIMSHMNLRILFSLDSIKFIAPPPITFRFLNIKNMWDPQINEILIWNPQAH